MQNNGAAPVLQLTGLHGDIIATAALSETETKLLSTTDASEYDVPTTSSPAKYSWLGGEQQPTEFPSGVIAMGVRSYVPQLGRYLQPDPVAGGSADAYAYVFGDPVNSSDPSGADGMPAWAVAYNNGVADQLAEAATAHRIEAEQRQAAEEAAARAAAAAAAQAAQAAAAAQFASTEAPWEQAYAMGGPSLSETIAATGITEGGGIEEEGSDPIAVAAAPCSHGDNPHSNSCGAGLPGRDLCSDPLLQGCGVTNSAPSGTRTGRLAVSGGVVGCIVGGVVGGTFAASSSAGLATEAGATAGCFIGGSIVMIVERL